MPLESGTRLGTYAIVSPLVITGDGRSHVYSYQQSFSDLFLVVGLR